MYIFLNINNTTFTYLIADKYIDLFRRFTC